MGLLENFARSVSGPAPAPTQPPRAMTAAGARIDLSRPTPITNRRVEWQTAAWDYRDSVPELQFVASFVRSSLGRLRVFPAERRPRGIPPQPLDRLPVPNNALDQVKTESSLSSSTRQAAVAASGRLNFDQQGSTLLARLGENLEFAGEAYLLGENGDEGEEWSIKSVSEVQIGNGVVRLIDPGGGMGGRELVPGQHELLRLWNPHPRFHLWPDSPIAALLETCEAMLLLSRRGRAHDRSRISTGKALYLPDELSVQRAGSAPTAADTEGGFEDQDPFLEELTAFMMTPILNDADPSAVVPLIIRGPAMAQDGTTPMKDVIGTIDLHNADPKDLDTRRDNLVSILARGIDLPPEVLTGIGDTNHWNGAVISAETVKSHIEPRAERMCDALTVAYLWPALKAMGIPREEREKVCLWFDPSELMQDPDRGQAAKDAHQAGVISHAAARRALGFSDEDAPSDTEVLTRTLTEGRAYEASIPVLIALSGLDLEDPKMKRVMTLAMNSMFNPLAKGDIRKDPSLDQYGTTQDADATGRANGRPPQVNRAGDRSRALPPAAPTTGNSPRNVTVRASAQREQVHRRASAKLARIDHELTVTLLAHAEATVGRATEKTANSLRNQARKRGIAASAFPDGCDPRAVLAQGGRALVAGLDDQAALEGALDDYAVRFERDVAAAARAVEMTVADMVGAEKAKGLAQRLTERARGAWQWLKQRLRERIHEVLYGENRLTPSEADTDLVPASLIRGAVAQVGGLSEGAAGVANDGRLVRGPGDPVRPATGPGTGIEVMDIMRGADAQVASWSWDYPANPRAHFEPHRALDGLEFSSWTDPLLDAGAEASWIGPYFHPGDHPGCLCAAVPLWTTPVREPELEGVG